MTDAVNWLGVCVDESVVYITRMHFNNVNSLSDKLHQLNSEMKCTWFQ